MHCVGVLYMKYDEHGWWTGCITDYRSTCVTLNVRGIKESLK